MNGIQFIQSQNDFPLTVNLDRKNPSWGLNRWNGQCLRFIPFDDEGFNLRGDKRWLLYNGRRRSHRFTILGDSSFEYDCILEKEPESNVVSLIMEGADSFDFFRQPDFVPDPFLKGSYAVYKKETLLGEGTGKLCHIHRPLIIDARGRKVWGELSVAGNELRITIPEWWLAEAKYPVVVDPTVGTTAVGSQNIWYDPDNESYDPLCFEIRIAVNRFLISEAINGLCTAYIYTNQHDGDGRGRPVLYSDNGNSPLTRRSSGESLIDLRFVNGLTAGWRSGSFTAGGVSAGSYVWFGVCTEYMWFPRFDYGARCYTDWWDDYVSIPNTYPVWNVSYFYDFKLSMYFNYTSAQNYVRTLTQGVRLNDSRKLTAQYKKTLTQTVRGSTVLSRFESFFRQCLQNVRNTTNFARLPVFSRSVTDQIKITDGASNKREIIRKFDETTAVNSETKKIQAFTRALKDNEIITDNRELKADYKKSFADTVHGTDKSNAVVLFFRKCAITVSNITSLARIPFFSRFVTDHSGIFDGLKPKRDISRKFEETFSANDTATRSQGFYRGVSDNLSGTDDFYFPVLFVRSISETKGISDAFQKWGAYIRGLYVEAGSVAEPVRWGDFYRKESDTVQVDGSVFRGLLIFVKILTTSIVRDFILRRFLVAREELVLKSCITRDLILESKIN